MPRTRFAEEADEVEQRVLRDLEFLKDFWPAPGEEEGSWNALISLVARGAAAAVQGGRLSLAESSYTPASLRARK